MGPESGIKGRRSFVTDEPSRVQTMLTDHSLDTAQLGDDFVDLMSLNQLARLSEIKPPLECSIVKHNLIRHVKAGSNPVCRQAHGTNKKGPPPHRLGALTG